jgi:hypothetical protein
MAKADAKKKGSRWRGQEVERRPTGEAERAADRAAGRTPIDVRTKRPIEPPKQGRLERPDYKER